MMFALGSVPVGGFFAGLLIVRLHWPNNPFLITVSDVVEDNGGLAEAEESNGT